MKLAPMLITCVTITLTLATFARAKETKVPVHFTGGHELADNDYGRPCALIAAGIGVETDVFREAFKDVKPAHGRGPTPAEARANKEKMMRVLRPYHVTNERLDKVANYYRFRPQDDELWPTQPAKAYAIVDAGRIKKIVVTQPGSGYNTPPTATVEGLDAPLQVTLHFDKNLKQNGSIEKVETAPKDEPADTDPQK